jgi:hypothetical protein
MRRLLCLAFVVWRANDQDSMNADDRLAKLRNDYQAFPEEEGPLEVMQPTDGFE